MRLLIEIEIQDKNVPIWSYSTGIIGYSTRNLKNCKEYLQYCINHVTGIKIINMKRKNYGKMVKRKS